MYSSRLMFFEVLIGTSHYFSLLFAEIILEWLISTLVFFPVEKLGLTLLLPGETPITLQFLEVLRIQVNVGSFNPSKNLLHAEKMPLLVGIASKLCPLR